MDNRIASLSTELEWAALRRQLECLIQEVGEEIRAYPAPIPACDVQFNRLLELRRLLPAELAQLAQLGGRFPSRFVAAALVDQGVGLSKTARGGV